MSLDTSPPRTLDSVGSQSGKVYSKASRQQKAGKILKALDLAIPDLTRAKLLDAGCASGIITRALAGRVGSAVGIDLDESGLLHAEAGELVTAPLFRATTAALPFANEAFDIVICAQVYEHVADHAMLASELYRILRPGGLCFFSGPNRTWPMEDHYRLPFLGWLPRSWADAWLRIANKGSSFDVHLLSTAQLKSLFCRFERLDLTPLMIKDPSAFNIEEGTLIRFASRLPLPILRRLDWIYPNPNWMLRKPAHGEALLAFRKTPSFQTATGQPRLQSKR